MDSDCQSPHGFLIDAPTRFDARGRTLHPVGDYQAPHAHSIIVDPSTHLIYLPLENVDGRPVLRIMGAVPPGD